jgi:hypothetical protein
MNRLVSAMVFDSPVTGQKACRTAEIRFKTSKYYIRDVRGAQRGMSYTSLFMANLSDTMSPLRPYRTRS